MEFALTDQQLNSEVTESNYVFFNDVFFNDSIAFSSSRDDGIRNQLTQSDAGSANVAVGSTLASRKLIGRLELVHALPSNQLPTFAGAQYRVALVQNPDQTFFNLEDDDTRVAIDASSYSNFGTVTIAAVPEPSSAVVLICTAGLASTLRRRRSHSGGR